MELNSSEAGTPALPDQGATPEVSGEEWDELLKTDDDDSNIAEPIDDGVETPAPTITPQVPSAPTPTAQPPQNAQAISDTAAAASSAKAAAAIPAPTPTPTPQVAEQPAPLTQEQIGVQRTNLLADLAKNYAITPEMATQIITEPEVVLPQLLAQAHLNAVTATMQLMQQQLPAMIQAHTQQQTTSQAAVGSFYSRWPQLQGEDKTPAVKRILSAYRAQNQNATPEQVIEEGGAMAMMALRIPFQTEAPSTSAPTRNIPPAPVGMGSATGARSATPGNPFELLAEELLNEE